MTTRCLVMFMGSTVRIAGSGRLSYPEGINNDVDLRRLRYFLAVARLARRRDPLLTSFAELAQP